LESTRAEEERVKRETRAGLEAFRRQQEEADKKAREGGEGQGAEQGSPVAEEVLWVPGGRKRKRKAEKEALKGVKIRRASSALEEAKAAEVPSSIKKEEDEPAESTKSENGKQTKPELKSKQAHSVVASKPPVAPPKSGLGLVDYRSDEDDDW
jgi:hypothetical protein